MGEALWTALSVVGFWLASVPSQVLTMWLSQGRLVLHVVILYVTGAETLFCGNLAASPTFFKHATGYGVLTGHVTRTLRATLLSLGYKLGNKHINDTKVMQLPADTVRSQGLSSADLLGCSGLYLSSVLLGIAYVQ